MLSFCQYPFQRIKVTCEGALTMCCFQSKAQPLGNVLETDLKEIWQSDLFNEIREVTLKNELHPLCKAATCPFRHLKDLASIAEHTRLAPMPQHLEIDLPTQHCNIGGENPTSQNPACLMCERHTNYTPQIDRLEEVCLALRPYVNNFRTVHIQGVAEPFWKGRIFEVVEDLGLDPRKVHITTTTNGTVFNEERMARWLSYPSTTTVFSIDASTPETFKTIRRLNAYDKVVSCLMEYSAKSSSQQHVVIHNNINLLNVNEVVGMVEVAAKAKVNLLQFNPTYATPDICVNKDNVRVFKKAEEDIKEAAARLRVKVDFMRNFTLDLLDDALVQLSF